MPLTPEIGVVVHEALPMTSAGRLAPQAGGALRFALRTGAWAPELELSITGTGTTTETRSQLQLDLRPALLIDAELRRGPFAAALAVGPAVTLRYSAWTGWDGFWVVAPGGRVRADLRWDLSPRLALGLGLGGMVRADAVDLDLGLGLRLALGAP